MLRTNANVARLATVILAGIGLAACSHRPSAPVPVMMRIGVGVPPTAVPDSGVGTFIRALKGDPWLTTQPDGRITDRIAQGWRWDDSGRVLTLKLRPDVYFHDGTVLTPEVAAACLRQSVAGSAGDSLSSVESVSVAGTDSIALRLKEPNAFIVEDLAAIQVVKPENETIGTGPFQLVAQDARAATLKGFPKYYRGASALAGLTVSSYPTQRSAWTALMRGDIDMLYEVSREAADFVQAETTVKTYTSPRRYYIPLIFNVRRAALRKAAVRQAINQGLDRAALVREGLSGRGVPADGPVPPSHWAYTPPEREFKFEPDLARQLLDAAGFPERISERSPVPMRLSFECIVYADDPRFQRLALLVQKQLAEIGIDMRLVPVTLKELGARFGSGDFDAGLVEMSGRSLSRVYEFWRSGGARLDTGYVAADPVLDRMRTARTESELRATVADLGRVIHDDPPAAFLAWQETARAVSVKFDVQAEDSRDILFNIWQWRPSEAAGDKAR